MARGVARQVPVAYLLKHTEVVDLRHSVARVLGRMLAHSGARDVVDAHVVFLAREREFPVLTSDPEDLRAIDSMVNIERI
ncbi:MAG TPA: hypothetical protein VHE30_19865 [Polyangiaceae bacterium]|nr:hypothetical protein [Polyangiaceae bacterium]